MEYAKARNAAKTEARKAIRDYEKEIAKQAKRNPKVFYRHVNNKLKTRNDIPNIRTGDGDEKFDDKQKADTFNNYFSSVYTAEDMKNMPYMIRRNGAELTNVEVGEEEVLKLLLKLLPEKSPGPDCIHPRVLKECATELAYPLTQLFHTSLKEGTVPRAWKEATVSPIFKKGSRNVVSNYRPISLTSVCCKILEKLVRNALMQHLLSNNYISDNQHGFVYKRSCTTQLIIVVDKISELLDRGGSIDMIYLDFAKAFDTVPHNRLLMKLSGYGVGGKVLEWIGQFLMKRRQRVSVAGVLSEWEDVLSGVPQGSVLGPLLFVCYINDMPDNIASFLYMYADDTKLFNSSNCEADRLQIQHDLDRLRAWARDWQLNFNIEKCKVMHMGATRTEVVKYSMETKGGGRSYLEETSLEKDLGIWFNNNLKPGDHIAHAVGKANQILGLIRRTFTYMDCQLMKLLYTALVRPHLEYGNVVWHPHLKKDIDMLENVQHRATRMVPGLSKLSYEERLKKLDIPTLAYRRARGDAIETYKYTHGMYMIDEMKILPRHNSMGATTRGHDLKLQKRQCSSQTRANTFGYRVVGMWNSLPAEVVNSSSVNCFKGRYDRLMKGSWYGDAGDDCLVSWDNATNDPQANCLS